MSLTQKQTTCPYCGVGCGIKAEVNADTHSIKIIGDKEHASNKGRLCSKGTALADTISLESRMLTPEVNGRETSWDEALDKVATGFKRIIEQHGPDAVAFYLSGQLLTEDYYVANKLMKGFIGSANVDTNSRLCMSSSVSGHKRAFGSDTVPGCYEDFEEAELIILVGSNTAWCHPVLFQRIRAHKESNRNVKIVVVDPRRTQTCDIADLHLPIALGTDTWLFNGLLNYLAENDCLDKNYIKTNTQGFTEALAIAKQYAGSVAQTAEASELEEDTVASFFQWFANTKKTVTLYSSGVHQSSSGTDKVNSIINCHLATGRIGQPGMGPFSMTGQPNAMGGREVGGLATTLAAHMDFTDDNVDRLKRFWHSNEVAEKPGLPAVALFDAIYEGKIKAVWIMATNPVASLPNADKVSEALRRCELVVVSDTCRHTDTTRLANVKLPATGWSEKDGTVTSSERLISRQQALFPPAGKAKHDWQIICDIAKRMGYVDAFDFKSSAEIYREHARLSGFENSADEAQRDFDISAHAHISQEEYDNMPSFQWPLNKRFPKGSKHLLTDGRFFTPNGKANFIAIHCRPPQHSVSTNHPLKLNTGRIRDQWHTMTRTALAPQLNQHISEPFVEVHPQDSDSFKLSNGAIAKISSQWGSMLAKVLITDVTRPGDLFIPMHWTGELSHQSRVAALVNPVVDPICFQPESKHTPASIAPYAAAWYGLLMTRKPITWPSADYLVQTNFQHYSRYNLADKRVLKNPQQTLLSWLKLAPEQEIISYEDSHAGIYRLAVFTDKGQLMAVMMVSRQLDDLPEHGWLGQQFAKDSIDERTRATLLSGQAPAGEDSGQIVCACFSVGEKTICNTIKEKQLATVDEIGKLLKAGTNCGSCIPELKQLLASTQSR